MPDLPLLFLTIFLPLVGAFFIMLIKGEGKHANRNAHAVALLTSLATFVLAGICWLNFDPSVSGFQLREKSLWLPEFRLFWYVGVDGISILLILLSTFLMPFVILACRKSITSRVRSCMVCLMFLETMMIGSFCALDAVLFYVFFEGVLIPMFLIIGIWGGERRIYSALKFFLYTLAGSVFMLLGIITITHQAGTTEIPLLMNHNFPLEYQVWLWLAFFASFAVKMPIWPFHTWLPDAHVEAPAAGSVILAGVLLKMGGYGFLRFSLPMFPDASAMFADFVFILAIISVVYTSFIALVQKDMKKLIAYSSVAHMGIVSFGAFSGTLQGIQGATFQMLSHGIVSASLFLCVGVLYDRMHTREIASYGGLARQMPVFAVLFGIFIFSSIGLPGTTGFVGEILVMISAFGIKGWMAFCLGLGMILGAAYGLNLYRGLMFGKLEKPELKKLLDLTRTEKTILVPLATLALFFGICPQPLLEISEPASRKILQRYSYPGKSGGTNMDSDETIIQIKEPD